MLDDANFIQTLLDMSDDSLCFLESSRQVRNGYMALVIELCPMLTQNLKSDEMMKLLKVTKEESISSSGNKVDRSANEDSTADE